MCEIRPGDVAAFRRAIRQVNRVLARIEAYLPTVRVYLDDDNAQLMTGPSHSGVHNPHPRQDRVRASVRMPGCSGGGW